MTPEASDDAKALAREWAQAGELWARSASAYADAATRLATASRDLADQTARDGLPPDVSERLHVIADVVEAKAGESREALLAFEDMRRMFGGLTDND